MLAFFGVNIKFELPLESKLELEFKLETEDVSLHLDKKHPILSLIFFFYLHK
jgi:hypothetical protein